jgi:hypothetical protein
LGGTGGSGGGTGTVGTNQLSSGGTQVRENGGGYGGGGGEANNVGGSTIYGTYTAGNGDGAGGAVRIVWGGPNRFYARQFPSTSTADM